MDHADVVRTPDLATARRRLIIRAVLASAVVLLAGWAARGWWAGAMYYLHGGDLVEIGDVRALHASGVSSLDVRPGSYVALKAMIVTQRADAKQYHYFFCPIYDVVVRTQAALPEVGERISEVSPDLVWLLEDRKVADATDLDSRFAGRGWLMRLGDAPAGVRDHFRTAARLSGDDIDRAWLLLDGVEPGDRWTDFAWLCAASLLVLLSLASVGMAWRVASRAKSA